MSRRAACLAVALLALAPGGANGAQVVASASGPSGKWTMTVTRRHLALCFSFVDATTGARTRAACSREVPSRHRLGVFARREPGLSIVGGLASPAVRRVRVQTSRGHASVAPQPTTRRLPGLVFFLVVLPGQAATATAKDGRGRPLEVHRLPCRSRTEVC